MAKRNNKIGYVYLLRSKKDIGVYKFGCTTFTPEKRCNRINTTTKNEYDFEVICSFLSKDCFASEHDIRKEIIPCGFGVFSEIFSIDGRGGSTIFEEIKTEELLINRFLKIGKVLV